MSHDDIDATRVAPLAGLRAAASVFDGRPILKVLSGPLLGRRIFLDFGDTTIGRADGLTITLPDANVSREHAAIFYDGRHFRLIDQESRNGTLVNGQPVVDHRLAFGDRVRLGDSDLIFTCEGFELAASQPDLAAQAYRRTLERDAGFVAALTCLRDLLASQPGNRDAVAELDRAIGAAQG